MSKPLTKSTSSRPRGSQRQSAPNAQTHGLTTAADRRNELPRAFEYLQQQIDAFVNGAIVDEGVVNESEIPARRRSHLVYRGRVHRRILQVDEALERFGLFDRRGKLRVAWISKLESLIATAIRIDNLLGLDRRPRRIESPVEWLERVAGEEEKGAAANAHSPHDNGDNGETDEARQTD